MGVQTIKGLNKQVSTIVTCPFCNMQLSEQITFSSLNCHIAKCHHKSGSNSRESTRNEDSSNDKSQSREKSFEELKVKLKKQKSDININSNNNTWFSVPKSGVAFDLKNVCDTYIRFIDDFCSISIPFYL